MSGDRFRPGPGTGKPPTVVYDARILSAVRGFYVRGLFLGFLALEIFFDLVLRPSRTLAFSSLALLYLLALADAHFLARFHYRDAVRNGPAFLVKRLEARAPILRLPAHASFEDSLERLRDRAGMPWIKPYAIPRASIDAVFFLESDGTPALAVTDVLMTGLAPSEMEAVLTQSLVRLGGKDAPRRTLLCGLADFFSRFAEAQFPSSPRMAALAPRLSAGLARRLSKFMDPQDEVRADEETARLGQAGPLSEALAKVQGLNAAESGLPGIYASLRFAPDPSPAGKPAGFTARPSALERLRLLAAQIGEEPTALLRRVRDTAAEKNDSA